MLKQREMTVMEYEAKFNKLSKYAPHMVATESARSRRRAAPGNPRFHDQCKTGPM